MAVDALTILDSPDDPYVAEPAGFYKIWVDLNRGAGGDYIFLAFRNGDGAAITGLFVADQGVAGARPPQGYQAVEPQVDLNKGAGGRYLYLCFTTDANAGAPIQSINVVTGGNADPPIPAGWQRVGTDLNEGAGGDYIYIIYST